MRLITYQQALDRLRISIPSSSPPSGAENDLRLMIDQAEALVIDFVNQRIADGDLWEATVDSWDVSADPAVEPPGQVTAAVLTQLTCLYRFRGDDLKGDAPDMPVGSVLHPSAAACLYRLKDPAIA
jgi:hypothetical protein